MRRRLVAATMLASSVCSFGSCRRPDPPFGEIPFEKPPPYPTYRYTLQADITQPKRAFSLCSEEGDRLIQAWLNRNEPKVAERQGSHSLWMVDRSVGHSDKYYKLDYKPNLDALLDVFKQHGEEDIAEVQYVYAFRTAPHAPTIISHLSRLGLTCGKDRSRVERAEAWIEKNRRFLQEAETAELSNANSLVIYGPDVEPQFFTIRNEPACDLNALRRVFLGAARYETTGEFTTYILQHTGTGPCDDTFTLSGPDAERLIKKWLARHKEVLEREQRLYGGMAILPGHFLRELRPDGGGRYLPSVHNYAAFERLRVLFGLPPRALQARLWLHNGLSAPEYHVIKGGEGIARLREWVERNRRVVATADRRRTSNQLWLAGDALVPDEDPWSRSVRVQLTPEQISVIRKLFLTHGERNGDVGYVYRWRNGPKKPLLTCGGVRYRGGKEGRTGFESYMIDSPEGFEKIQGSIPIHASDVLFAHHIDGSKEKFQVTAHVAEIRRSMLGCGCLFENKRPGFVFYHGGGYADLPVLDVATDDASISRIRDWMAEHEGELEKGRDSPWPYKGIDEPILFEFFAGGGGTRHVLDAIFPENRHPYRKDWVHSISDDSLQELAAIFESSG